MRVKILKNSVELGEEAAAYTAAILNENIKNKGFARLLVSTGASQFDTLKALVNQDVDWTKVEMFHLDEYINLPENHPASFRKYLEERFLKYINIKKSYFVNGKGEVDKNIQQLTAELRKRPIDIALIGIGENAHIAFNDPPANFDTKEAYIKVSLDDNCKRQQVREGWFATIDDVPKQAISMSVYQIMQSEVIVSSVPYKVKANAIKLTLETDLTNKVPATMLKCHKNFSVFLDEDSASLVSAALLKRYV